MAAKWKVMYVAAKAMYVAARWKAMYVAAKWTAMYAAAKAMYMAAKRRRSNNREAGWKQNAK